VPSNIGQDHLSFETISVDSDPNYLAPDGSEIRLLVRAGRGSLAHCTLPAGTVSKALHHRTVEEIWYFIAGEGEVWRKLGQQDETVQVIPGKSLTIPEGTHFQFRNIGSVPLQFVIVSMPPWPIPHTQETVDVPGKWTP
jgi:mannose-6-phosphate isomerase-like protein (cupin superfamily)